jgi:eukaryotic-like serine/threonine-protein kinase
MGSDDHQRGSGNDDARVRERPAALDETLEAGDRMAGPYARPERRADEDQPSLRDREGRRRLIESPASDYPDLVPVDPDHYVHGYEVARGGMGRIVAARDRRLGRVVAIKELIQDTPERAARLEREAVITARLQHPAIVNLHEAGRWPTGQPFYSMKLVAGRSLAQVAAEGLPLRERLALLPNLIAMVEAVAYAHRQRIIHRDLKPSNVLIGDLGETVVIDWGLAKDLTAAPGDRTHLPLGTEDTLDAHRRADDPTGPRDGGPRGGRNGDGDRRPDDGAARLRGTSSGLSTASLTVAGSVMGTPGYMPPEQASARDVDERADVYALGAIFYHLLGGVEPYKGASADAILAAVLVGPPAPLARAEPGLPTDLVTIIEKAMARERDARYPTAVQLAEDLRRFQTGKLVDAHRYSRRELVWRFLVRHRAAAVVTAAALVVVAVMALVSFQRVVAERDRAELAGAAAARRADELAVAQAGSLLDDDPRAALELLARLSPAATPETWRTARMVASDARLRGVPQVLRGFEGPLHAFDLSPDGRALVAGHVRDVWAWDLPDGQGRQVGHQEALIQNIAVSPDGSRAVTAGLDNRLRLWSIDDGTVTELGAHDAMVTGMHFLPDGQRLVTAGGDGAIWSWQLDGREHVRIGSHRGRVLDFDVTPDGATMASVGEDAVRVWRVGQVAPLRELHPTPGVFSRVALSPDGSRVAAVGSPHEVWLWHVATGEGRSLGGHDEEVLTVDFSADSRRLATAGSDQTIRLWDVATGESEVLRGHGEAIELLTFAAGADLLFSSARDGTVRVWMTDGRSASAVQVLGGHDRGNVMKVSEDGSVVVTASVASLLRRWQVGAISRSLRGHRSVVTEVEFTPDGRVVSASDDWTVRVWPQRGQPRVMRGHEAGVVSLAVSPDGRLAASLDGHEFAWLWDLRRGTGRRLSGRATGDVRFSADGGLVAAPSLDHAVRLWSTASGEARLLRGHTDWVTSIALSSDGRYLASSSADRTVRLWDLATGNNRALQGHDTAVRRVEFAGPGHVVSSDMAGSVREWDVARGTGREIGRVPGGQITLAISADGEQVAWAAGNGDAYLWSRRTGKSRMLARREQSIVQLLFSPDGRTLVGRNLGSRVLLWDTASAAVLVLPSQGRTISDLAISPAGLAVATADSDRTVRLWPYDLPYEPEALRWWLVRTASAAAAPSKP